jgi:hypothetical protein
VEVGGTSSRGDRIYLRRALSVGDVLEVVVTDVETPDPGVPWAPHLAQPPDPDAARFPWAFEVSRNGAVLDVLRITPENRVVVVTVTWSLGAMTNPTMGEYVHLEYNGAHSCVELIDGDVVRVRALPA